MKINKWMMLGVVASSTLLLAGCSKHPGSMNAAQEQPRLAAGQQGGAGARTYAMGQSGNFTNARYAFHKNSLTAPSNQTYYFAFNQSTLTPAAYRALNTQANYLARHPNVRIQLQGNTDSRGSRKYNYGLGLRRDQSVARYLEQRGVSSSQINMISYGKEKPAVTVTELGRSRINEVWALNRRVNLIYR